jgi:hypothetical protein
MKDHEAYNWLRENGIDKGTHGQGMDCGELTDYEPPAFETLESAGARSPQRTGRTEVR